MKTIEINMVESFTTTIFRNFIKLNVEDYPELKGLSDEEIESYIQDNYYDMKATSNDFDNLGEELMNQDITREKITGEETTILFE